jgi:hypothetical protein
MIKFPKITYENEFLLSDKFYHFLISAFLNKKQWKNLNNLQR